MWWTAPGWDVDQPFTPTFFGRGFAQSQARAKQVHSHLSVTYLKLSLVIKDWLSYSGSFTHCLISVRLHRYTRAHPCFHDFCFQSLFLPTTPADHIHDPHDNHVNQETWQTAGVPTCHPSTFSMTPGWLAPILSWLLPSSNSSPWRPHVFSENIPIIFSCRMSI